MANVKIRNDLPEPLPRDEMIERINEILQREEYRVVYMTYVFLDSVENDK